MPPSDHGTIGSCPRSTRRLHYQRHPLSDGGTWYTHSDEPDTKREEYFGFFFNPGRHGFFVEFWVNPEEGKVNWFYITPAHDVGPHKKSYVYDLRNVGEGHDITDLGDGWEGRFKDREAFLKFLYGPGGEAKQRVYSWENKWVAHRPDRWWNCTEIGMEVAVDLPELFSHYRTPRPRVEWFPGYEHQIGVLLDVPEELNNAKPYFGKTFKYHTERTLKAAKEGRNIYRDYMVTQNAATAAAVGTQDARRDTRQPGSLDEGNHNSGISSSSGLAGAERNVEREQQGLKPRGRSPSPEKRQQPASAPAEKQVKGKEPKRPAEQAKPTGTRDGMTGNSTADRNAERLLQGRKQRGRPKKSVAEEEVAEPGIMLEGMKRPAA